eukprot:754988-Hanusia_phi.AAC.3
MSTNGVIHAITCLLSDRPRASVDSSSYRVLVPDVKTARDHTGVEPEKRRRTGHVELLLPALFTSPQTLHRSGWLPLSFLRWLLIVSTRTESQADKAERTSLGRRRGNGESGGGSTLAYSFQKDDSKEEFMLSSIGRREAGWQGGGRREKEGERRRKEGERGREEEEGGRKREGVRFGAGRRNHHHQRRWLTEGRQSRTVPLPISCFSSPARSVCVGHRSLPPPKTRLRNASFPVHPRPIHLSPQHRAV